MLQLPDLPTEVLARLAASQFYLLAWNKELDNQWRRTLGDIAALSRTCRTLHKVYNPLLYQSLAITNLPLSQRLSLMRTMITQPYLATLVEELKLDFFERRYPLRDDSPPTDDADRVTQYRDASDGDWYRLLGSMFFPFTTQLKHLAVRCTRYEQLSCDFSQLTSATIQSYCQGPGIGINGPGALQLLLAPELRWLTLSGPYISNATKLESLEPATSNISVLVLRIVLISIETITTIIRVPRHLSSLEFYSASMRAPLQRGSTAHRHVTFKQLHEVLSSLQGTLTTAKICYPSFDEDVPHTIYGGLTFRDFSRLARLSIAPEMYLGWKPCQHEDYSTDRDLSYPDPTTFADCLPHCLEELTIFVQQYQRPRNGEGFMHDVVHGVLRQSGRLYKLAELELRSVGGGRLACRPCRIKAMTYLARDGTVKNSEIAEIRYMCEEAGLTFRWVAPGELEEQR